MSAVYSEWLSGLLSRRSSASGQELQLRTCSFFPEYIKDTANTNKRQKKLYTPVLKKNMPAHVFMFLPSIT